MAGSLNHIVAEDGRFTMSCVDHMGDAHEALEECHQIIAGLLHLAAPTDAARADLLQRVCRGMSYPTPRKEVQGPLNARPVNLPRVQPELHGRGCPSDWVQDEGGGPVLYRPQVRP